MKKLWFVVLAVAVIAIAAAASLSPPANDEGSCFVASNEQLTGEPNIIVGTANVSNEVPITRTVVGLNLDDNDTTVAYPAHSWHEETYVRPATTGRVALNSIQATKDNTTANSYGTEATHFRCLVGNVNPPYT